MKQDFRVVVAGVVIRDNKILLAKRKPKDENLPGFWSIPAGHVEVNKSSGDTFESTLKRELQEEVDMRVSNLEYLDSHVWVDGKNKKITVVFRCEARGEPSAEDETQEVGWFTLDEVRNFNLPSNVMRVLEKAFAA